MLEGPSASGKTSLAIELLQADGQAVIPVSRTPETSLADLFGEFRPGAKGCKYVRGPLHKALEEGLCLIIDDLSLAPRGVIDALSHILVANEVFNPLDGSWMSVHKNFFAIVTTRSPDGLENTAPIPSDMYLRMAVIKLPAYTREEVQKILELHRNSIKLSAVSAYQSQEGEVELRRLLIIQHRVSKQISSGSSADTTQLINLVAAVLDDDPNVTYDLARDEHSWVFKASLGDVRIEQRMTGPDTQIDGLPPTQKRLLVQLALAVGNQEHVLITGPSCFKSHIVKLFGEMTKSVNCFGPKEITLHSSFDLDGIIGGLEPHTAASFARYLCTALLQLDASVTVDSISQIGCFKYLSSLLGSLPKESEVHRPWLERMREAVAAETDQYYVVCERGVLPSVRWGGLCVLDHINLGPTGVTATINNLLDRPETYLGVPVHSSLRIIGVMTTPGRLLSPALQSRMTVLVARPEPEVLKAGARRSAWLASYQSIDSGCSYHQTVTHGQLPKDSLYMQPAKCEE